ncbi:MAG: hypothetical protein HUJ51_01280 [Eggerthellaceae bacterium]|nr:hypothetical protein [Eggerthellaceae bacterium]
MIGTFIHNDDRYICQVGIVSRINCHKASCIRKTERDANGHAFRFFAICIGKDVLEKILLCISVNAELKTTKP